MLMFNMPCCYKSNTTVTIASSITLDYKTHDINSTFFIHVA